MASHFPERPTLCQCGQFIAFSSSVHPSQRQPRQGDISICEGCFGVYGRTAMEWVRLDKQAVAALPHGILTEILLLMTSLHIKNQAQTPPPRTLQ